MSSLFPLRSEQPPQPGESTRIIGIDDSDAGRIVEALGSEMTRDILAELYEKPGPATEIADRVDTSLQNANYHLDKLQEVGLIEIGDTWYAEGGNEMKVYVPAAESVVLLAGRASTQRTVKETLTQAAGTVGMVAVGGLVVDRLIALPQRGMQAASGEGAAMTAETADMAAESAAEPSLLPLAELGGWLTPGALFALGGAFALAIVLLVLVVNRYR